MKAVRLASSVDRWELGEGPLWDGESGLLHWVDSENGLVLTGQVTTGPDADVRLVSTREFDGRVGSVAVASDGGLLVAVERDVLVVSPTGEITRRIPVIPSGQSSRLNDGTCDPTGRFLVGSIRLDDRSAHEHLYAIGADGSVHVVVDGITVSNGIGFTADARTMYYVDSRPGRILAFDYDPASGTASRQRVLQEPGGTPDGLAMDDQDRLWVAFFGEGEVRCIDASGAVVEVVEVPVPRPTCPEFAGPDLDILVIATALYRMNAEQRATSPDSGALYAVRPGVRGRPSTRWAGTTR